MKKVLTAHVGLSSFDEAELIARVQDGDTEAFNPIVHRYQEMIYDLMYQQVHHHETAEDLCQEVFLKAWQALPNFKRKSVFYSWLYRIAVNCSIDFLRRKNTQIIFDCVELSDDPDGVLQMNLMESSPDQFLEKKELRQIIRTAMRRLPFNQHRVFYLHQGEGLRIKEIASRLKKSEGTIKTQLHQARRKLRTLLRPYLRNEPFKWSRKP